MVHGFEYAFAQVAQFVAVTQLNGFARTGGRARGHGSAAHGAGLQQHITFDRGVPTAIQNLPTHNIYNRAHLLPC